MGSPPSAGGGGKDHRDLPNWSLSAADFVLCKAESFDACAMPPEAKLEPRPGMSAVFSTWKRQAENRTETSGREQAGRKGTGRQAGNSQAGKGNRELEVKKNKE